MEDMILVVNEQDASPIKKQKVIKRLKKLAKQGKLQLQLDSMWSFRLFAARIMNGNWNDWKGWEYRSKWAWEHNDPSMPPFVYPKYQGGNNRCLVMAEQGIGDEILFSSVWGEFLEECPDAVFQCDNRLLPIMRRSFPHAEFVSRWVDDKMRTPLSPANYKPGAFDSYVPAGDLLRHYRQGHRPSGLPWLIPHEGMTQYYKMYLSRFESPTIALSWKGGRSDCEPSDLMCEKGTYFSAQYTKGVDPITFDSFMKNDDSIPELECPPELDHEYVDGLFSFINACDKVTTTQNYIAHVAGSIGKTCDVVRPPPVYGDEDDPDNNRLKWYYGKGGKMPWYNSVTYHPSIAAWRSLCNRTR